jgi:type VI secretion system secreted protein VgrG
MTVTADTLAASAPALSVEVASGDVLDVRRFHVQQRISTVFSVNLIVVGRNPDIDFDAVVGGAASFTIHRPGDGGPALDRTWTGLTSQFRQTSAEENGGVNQLSEYSLTLVPTLWLLSQRRNYRMFQQISELDIAIKVLEEWGIKPIVSCDRSAYKTRKYKVQYAETDLAFVSRMLEECGVCYYFKQTDQGTKLVLSDAPQLGEVRTPTLEYHDRPSRSVREFVTRIRTSQLVRPGKYTMRDHDARLAPELKLLASASGGLDVEQRLEDYNYTPGAFLFGADKGEDTPFADDKGKSRTDTAEATTLAQKRLDAERSNAKLVTFETNAFDLSPGGVVVITGHPRSDLGAKEPQLVLDVSIHGARNESYACSCETRSAKVAYRPPLTTPKPRVAGVESATVVGPPGEEIHTDEFGRIRVHFHWDRESKMNDNSSCWIHVSQSWGGAGYGGSQLPRVGQEVIVDFLSGDPDRPVVVGRVYTNLQKKPAKLPDNKTQTHLKSNSTNRTGGYNEIMMEDAAGRELLRMQAELDYTFLVKRNWTTTVGHDRTDITKNDNTEQVTGNQTVAVQKNREVTVTLDEKKTVVGKRDVIVLKDQMHAVKGNIQQSSIEGAAVHTSQKMTVVRSEESIALLCGASYILITPEKITIQSPRVEINPGGGGGGGGE